MSKKQLTVAAAGMLVLGFQIGCQGAGRFSREEYAQLEVDPFLTAEPGKFEADEDTPAFMTDIATGGRPDRSGFVNGQSSTGDAESTSRDVEDSRQQLSSHSDVAPSAAPDLGRSLAQSPPGQSAADTDAGFDEFLRQNEEKVVQASAVFQEDVHEVPSARQKVIQADHTVFPADHQKVEIQDPADDSSAAETNPFAVPDELSSGESESSDHTASWRPDNFKDVMLAE